MAVEEEGPFQPLDRQRRPEDVADIMAVIAPSSLPNWNSIVIWPVATPRTKFDGELALPQNFGHLPPDRAVGLT